MYHSCSSVRLIGPWILFPALACSGLAEADYTSPYTFTTLAGAASIGSSDGPGDVARFYTPRGLAIDGGGAIYVADTLNHTIRKIAPDGIVSTLAGTAGISTLGSELTDFDGTGGAARFANPEGIAVDAAGTVYVADKLNSTIRKITPTGVVTTWAGSPRAGGSVDGTGPDARFFIPGGLAVDPAGNVYVAEWVTHIIRKITPAGVVTTLAGLADNPGSADGAGTDARFFQPTYVAVDRFGVLYVSDVVNNTVRKISADGVVTTLAGAPMQRGYADGTGAVARFQNPEGIAVDAAGNLFVADEGNFVIRRITPSGEVTTLAGSAGQAGSDDGLGAAARFRSPRGLAIDARGNLYVCDEMDNTIRRVTPDGNVTTIAGLGLEASTGSKDGTGSAARFENAIQVAAGPAGDAFVADTFNHTVRRIAPNGAVTTVAGSSTADSANNEDGPAAAARFAAPGPIAVDAAGAIYVGELTNGTIRRISPDRVVTTLNGVARGTAQFDGIGGLAVDGGGNLFVSDKHRHTIRRLSAAGVITLVAGADEAPGSADGTGGGATFRAPGGLVVDPAGNLFVADTDNHLIRKIAASGEVTTLAGQAGLAGDADGPGATARFSYPSGISRDSAGNLFVADSSNSTIRKITPEGIVSTVAGIPGAAGSAGGTGRQARFYFADDVAVDTTGSLLVASGSTVVKGQLAGPPTILTQPASQSAVAGAAAQFSVTANGAPAPTYQWYFNGVAVSGATASSFALASVTAANAGDYTVVVTNDLGSVNSGKATLTVAAAPTPAPAESGSASGGGGLGAGLPLGLSLLAALRALARRGAFVGESGRGASRQSPE